MKKFSTRKSLVCLMAGLFGIFGLANAANALTSTGSHEQFTRALDNSMQWAQHLKDEVAKGKKMDRTHAKQEMTSLQESFNEMTNAYLELSKQPAPEVAEGHFVAIKQNQIRAEAELMVFDTEFGRANPDYGVMKKSAKSIDANLKGAAAAHKADLDELDVK